MAGRQVTFIASLGGHLKALIIVLGLALYSTAPALVFEPRDFASEEIEARYKHLIAELRCLVCQNQNIAESDAPLAQDLRREVFNMLSEQRSDQQILDYMVARYGDFVLYRPPLNPMTWALWFGPWVLALAGFLLLWFTMRRKAARSPQRAALTDAERERLRRLMDDAES